MKKNRYFAAIFLSVFFSVAVQAQVTGTVTDKAGDPLPGANLVWLGMAQGTTANASGEFELTKPKDTDQLVVSYIGFENDTVMITNNIARVHIILTEGVELSEVQVTGRKLGTMKLRNSVMNEDMITTAELSRAACCNLGESFTTNPSVDVSYSDAATGARQIRLLGLSGAYVQMLTENIPNLRGAAAPYALSHIPGPWMQSIQVSKGTSSVKNGYESITGQINVEFKKPQTADRVTANLFAASTGRIEANADAGIRFSPRWSAMLLVHHEDETNVHDSNKDGFADMPSVRMTTVFPRMAYMGDHYVLQAGVKALTESRRGGQITHSAPVNPYEIDIDTRRYEAFAKQAYIFNKERNTNLALILSGSKHKQESEYGRNPDEAIFDENTYFLRWKTYDVEQTNAYASLLFETDLPHGQNLSAGLSVNYDKYDQEYTQLDYGRQSKESMWNIFSPEETTKGAYVQYTWNHRDKLILMGGVRVDHSTLHGTFVTPRAHVKYNISDYINLRLSAGKGYRSVNNMYEFAPYFASNRHLVGVAHTSQEEAWNAGISVATYIPIAGRTLNFNAEYFYTRFLEQAVVDLENYPFGSLHSSSYHDNYYGDSFVYLSPLDGRSFSHVLQVEASYPFFDGFTLTAAWRFTNVKCSYGGMYQEKRLLEKPFVNRYKGLLTASYLTPLGLWQFDATLQLNGGGRLPSSYTEGYYGQLLPEKRFHAFEQLSAQITRYFRWGSIYVGGENLTGFKQKNPIVSADHPWSKEFDATMVWGPTHGAKGYIGVRYTLPR